MRKLVLALAVSLLPLSSLRAQPAAWADKLFGGDTTHDFGVVARGAQLKHTFKLTNIYKVALDITDIKISCGCLRAEPSTRSLQPGETATLNILMDGKQFSGVKVIRVNITVGPKYVSTATLVISANARGDVVFNPGQIDFGNLHRGQTPTKTIDIEYAGNLPNWRVTEIVKNASAPFELKVEPLAGAPAGKGFRILATIKADPAAGSFKQDILLKTNDPASPVVSFQVVGNVQAGLAVSPNPVVVKDLKVGEAQTKKVIVRASRPFRVTAVEGQGDGITVDIPNRMETAVVLTVHLSPTKAGDLKKTLMIRTDLDQDATPLVIEATIEP